MNHRFRLNILFPYGFYPFITALSLLISSFLSAAEEKKGSDKLVIGVQLKLGHELIKADKAISLLKSINARSFRDRAPWVKVEVYPKQFTVDKIRQLDKVLKWTEKNQIRPLLLLAYGNERLYANSMPPVTDRARAAFAEYAKFIARRYGSKVFGLQLWNEWNIGLGGFKARTILKEPKYYVKLVKTVAPVIRQENVSVNIVCSGVANHDLTWMENTFRQGILEHCDMYAIHPYVHSAGSKGTPFYAFKKVDEVKRLVDSYTTSDMKKSLVISELGWPTHQYSRFGWTEKLQKYFLAQSLLYTHARPRIKGFWWYQMVNNGNNVRERENNFGMFDTKYKAKGRASSIYIQNSTGNSIDLDKLDIAQTMVWFSEFIYDSKVVAHNTSSGDEVQWVICRKDDGQLYLFFWSKHIKQVRTSLRDLKIPIEFREIALSKRGTIIAYPKPVFLKIN